MKTNIRAATMLSALAIVLSIASAGVAQRILGGYKEIPNDDAEAVESANFAVKVQSDKTEKEFQLGEIAKAERQVVAGSNYRLCMQVIANEDEPYFVQAVVYLDLRGNRSLTSWADSDCGGASEAPVRGKMRTVDHYKPVDKTDAGVGLAADFAVKEQSAKTKTKITLGEIVNAEDQEPKLGARNFRLCLKVTAYDKPSSAQAVVTMDQYSNFKLVSWADSKCGETVGDGFTQVANTDAGIGLAADFAVKKHSEDTNIKHTLAGILKGENKGKFEMTYRVCMRITEKDESFVIQAVVTMDQYSNMKLVSWEHSTCGN